MASKGLLEMAQRIPRKVVYVLTLLVVIIPLFFPWNLPIAVSPETQIMFDHIEALRGTGKRVLFLCDAGAKFWGELHHSYFAVIQHIFLMEDVKLMIAPIDKPDTVALMHSLLSTISNPLNKEYGVDYVQLPLIPSMEPAIGSLIANFRAAYTVDESGTPIDELPVFDGVNTLEDFEIILWSEAIKWSPAAARLIYPTFPDITYFVLCNAEGYVFCAAYIGVGMPYTSGLVGMRPAAEYQTLYGGPYTKAVAQMDAISGYHLLGIALIILGNLALLGKKLGVK